MCYVERSSVLRARLTGLFAAMLHGHCGRTGDHVSDLAGAAGISSSYLSNIMNGNHGIGVPADLVVFFVRVTGDAGVLAAMAERCGYALIEIEGGDLTARNAKNAEGRRERSLGDAVGSAAEVLELSAQVARELAGSVGDGKITEEELRTIEGLVPGAVRSMHRLVGVARELAGRKFEKF